MQLLALTSLTLLANRQALQTSLRPAAREAYLRPKKKYDHEGAENSQGTARSQFKPSSGPSFKAKSKFGTRIRAWSHVSASGPNMLNYKRQPTFKKTQLTAHKHMGLRSAHVPKCLYSDNKEQTGNQKGTDASRRSPKRNPRNPSNKERNPDSGPDSRAPILGPRFSGPELVSRIRGPT